LWGEVMPGQRDRIAFAPSRAFAVSAFVAAVLKE
jgi:hypothetical protein